MTSQDKLIKQGIKYTDRLFDEVSKRIEKGVRKSDTLEEFLVQYHKAFPEKGNPLVSLGYDKEMLDIILSETNNHKFSRPSQKELVRVTIENQVGDLLVDVGDEVKESVRSIVSDGYDNNLSQDEIAENISNRVGVIKNKRARAIARTEIARTATISDYIVNKERGATGWYVECRNTACPVCKNAWHKGWTLENDDSFTPSDTSAGGKGWIGDRIFSMNDTGMLPPIHPNCRCVVYYTTEEPNVSSEPVQQTTSTTVEEPVAPTPTGHSTHELIRTYEDHADARGRKETVYVYDDVEIALCSDANLTVDEVRAHLDFLPKEFLENTNRISIKDYKEKDTGGDFDVGSRNVRVLHTTNKESQLDVITHELAHSTDRFVNNNRKDNSEPIVISKHAKIEIWEKIFKEDNKLYTYTKANGRKRTPKKFPTEYAGKSWLKFKKNKLTKPKIFSEDYAESCKLYFNPKTHEKFCKDFPNRAKYIQNEFGKPNFKKSIFEQITAQDNEVKVKLQQEKAKKEKAQSEEFKKWFTPEKQKQYNWAKKEYEKYSIMKKALMYDDSELLVKNGYFDKKEASDFVKNKNKHLSRVNERAYKLKRIVQGVEEQMAKLK